MVKRGELRLIQALDDSQHGGVNEPDGGISVPFAHLTDSLIILRDQILNDERPGGDVIKERNEYRRMKPSVNPVIDLNKHRGRHDE